METIYFPACGFGFWYLLGKYERIRENQSQYILSGSSAGSLICLCSLVDFGNDDNFTENVAQVASDTLDECRKQSYFLNYHNMNDIFISKLFAYIDETSEKTKDQLTRLRIQTTKFHPPSWFEKCQTTPTSLAHLRELCVASCYIPLLSNHNNCMTFPLNGEQHIDGGFIDMYIPYTVSFNVPVYNILKLPSKQTVMEMRDTAYNEPFVINHVSDGRVLIYSMSLFIGCMRPLL
jgi:hypothetical protein